MRLRIGTGRTYTTCHIPRSILQQRVKTVGHRLSAISVKPRAERVAVPQSSGLPDSCISMPMGATGARVERWSPEAEAQEAHSKHRVSIFGRSQARMGHGTEQSAPVAVVDGVEALTNRTSTCILLLTVAPSTWKISRASVSKLSIIETVRVGD